MDDQKLGTTIEYSSGESDSEFLCPFNDLGTKEKKLRILFLWQKLFKRAKGCILIIKKNNFQRQTIEMLGKFKDVNAKVEEND